MITGFKGISYEERLRLLKITTLETRRLRGDLIETFKIMKGYEGIDASNFFELTNTVTRGHNLKFVRADLTETLEGIPSGIELWMSGILYHRILLMHLVLMHLRIDLIAILCMLRGLNKLRLPSPYLGHVLHDPSY